MTEKSVTTNPCGAAGQIVILRPDLFRYMASVCFILSRDPELEPEMSARIADIADSDNIDVVNIAVARGYSTALHSLSPLLTAGPDSSGDDEYRFFPSASLSAPSMQRLAYDLFEYLAECGICAWLILVAPHLAAIRLQFREEAFRRLSSQSAATGRARIVPRPF